MINFGSGPAALPDEVKLQLQLDILDFKGSGFSVLELPHRGRLIQNLIEETNDLVKSLMNLPPNYQVIWMQGGGRLQFHMIPLNFLKKDTTAAYVISGHWAKQAYLEALKLGDAQIVSSSEEKMFQSLPDLDFTLPEPAQKLAYLHYCSNNTIYGTQFKHFKKLKDIPLIVDMSSDILTRRLDYRPFDLIYAVAQKNLGIPGITMVVIKEDLLKEAAFSVPDILSYPAYVRSHSTVNTPAVFQILTTFRMLEWMKEKDLNHIFMENEKKAQLLYDFLDQSVLFEPIAHKDSRSQTNVCFRLKSRSIYETEVVLEYLKNHRLYFLSGHRNIGGFRAGLYNAISLSDVQCLIDVLKKYESQY